MKSSVNRLVFFVNGKKVSDDKVDPEWTLLYYLRNKLRLCGTKLGCAEGGCGACTVMISKYNRKTKNIQHLPVNACLAPICSIHGLAVTTIEGIGSTKTRLHPVQERMAKAHGSQCGFCTPGIVMSMYTVLRTLPKPSMADLETAFQGNLCRCTGYRAIIEGYKTFTEDWEIMQNARFLNGDSLQNGNGVCGMGKNCCKLQKSSKETDNDFLFNTNEFMPYDATQEPIFPPELKVNDTFDKEYLVIEGKEVTWYRPTTLQQLLELKSKYPDAKIIVGNSEVGVEVKMKHFIYPVLIQPNNIGEMTVIETKAEGVRIGAAVTLEDMRHYLQEQIENVPEHKSRIFQAIVEMLHWFAGKQIRSVAAVGGNIMTGSPISDLNPIFLAAQIQLELMSEKGTRSVPMDEHFFVGYRRNIVRPDEILLAINIPFSKEGQYFYAYKQARRRDDDIAIVNYAMNVTFAPRSNIVEDINLAFGGMAPTTVTAQKTRQFLRNKPWNQQTLEEAQNHLIEDLPLPPNAPGGMIQYRRSLTLSFFFRAFLTVSQHLQSFAPSTQIARKDVSAIETIQYKVPKSSQYFQVYPNDEKLENIGRPIVHASAYKQACGEAIYCDDMPFFENELYMAIVFSTKAYANIISIDPTEALRMEGVHAFFSAKDIAPKRNKTGPVEHDEEIMISKTVTSVGQNLGIVIADNQYIAQRAARAVKVVYEELRPIIVTIEDAIKHQSFFLNEPKSIVKGDVDQAFASAPFVLKGECRNGGQEHFYLETQCCIAVPKKEDDEMELYSSTQHPSEVNKLVSEMLGIAQHKIVTRVKRMGGGFGGKESKANVVALPVAFAAHRLNRPVRCMLDRDEDMLTTGTRHPFYSTYKVAFDHKGKIIGAECFIYNNAGYSKDLSISVLERAMLHFENAYKIPNVRVYGQACRTNLPSNTAFRGFGGPQGMFVAENMVTDIAEFLRLDADAVRSINLYQEGDCTHYNQELTYCTLSRCWNECVTLSRLTQAKQDVEAFNRENRWKKRGVSIIPTKFGIAFTALFLNQAGALIHVYTDGSVLLSHGGTEMGQGLHTKMLQVASKALDIPIEKIHISETSTDKVPNTSATAASAGSDLNGMAVLNACKTIKERLKPFQLKNPKGKWDDWVSAAYFARVSLSATGFYSTPDLGYDWETNTGNVFNYFTYGAACSVVEIDCLTGDHQVLQTDIVMDLGESLNPAIDIGQVEGGFIQGYGLFVLEEMVYSPNGQIFTRGPGAYKLPGFADIPVEFNVSLLKGAPNPRAVYSSKAVGEPPLFLASSIFFAIREAIKEARKDAGVSPTQFKLDAPATSARIRMACEDMLTKKLDEPKPGSFLPWNVTP